MGSQLRLMKQFSLSEKWMNTENEEYAVRLFLLMRIVYALSSHQLSRVHDPDIQDEVFPFSLI
jgi:hypothetical protein